MRACWDMQTPLLLMPLWVSYGENRPPHPGINQGAHAAKVISHAPQQGQTDGTQSGTGGAYGPVRLTAGTCTHARREQTERSSACGFASSGHTQTRARAHARTHKWVYLLKLWM